MAIRKPDKEGVARAWHIPITEEAIQAHIREWGYPPAPIDTWYVNGPYNLFWHWWMVSTISLADIPGIPPANKQYPEAEYEFTIYSIDGTPNIKALDKGDVDNRGFKSILQPADVTFHFHGVTDEQAKTITEHAVRAICDGISCDSGNREWWKTSLARTVEHYVLGVHE